MMNRSAKDGARSSRHYCGEGILTHPSHQGVCERHGTEDLDVTPGGLVVFPGGTGTTDPISREAKWERMRGEQSDNRIVLQARTGPIFLFISVLEPQLAELLRRLSGNRQSIVENDLCGPVAAVPIGAERVRDVGQEDTHGRQPLLAVNNSKSLHHPRRAGLREPLDDARF